MVDEVLARWTKSRAAWTGESFGEALEAILDTEAGREMRELGSGPHRHERAEEWQAKVARKRAEKRTEALGWHSPPESPDLPTDG